MISPSRDLLRIVRSLIVYGYPTLISLLAAWILQVSGNLNIGPGYKTILGGGSLSKNIVWVVSGPVTLGAGAHIDGIVLSATSITLNTGSSINGRLLGRTSVSLQKAVVRQP